MAHEYGDVISRGPRRASRSTALSGWQIHYMFVPALLTDSTLWHPMCLHIVPGWPLRICAAARVSRHDMLLVARVYRVAAATEERHAEETSAEEAGVEIEHCRAQCNLSHSHRQVHAHVE